MTGTFDPVENTWTPPEGGWRYTNLHPANEECATDGCMIHNPDEAWVGNREGWPYSPRADGRMERLCPHGVGHPDPDAARFLNRTRPNLAASIHGCDGCCFDGGEA